MKDLFIFGLKIYKKQKENDIYVISNALSFKLVLSIFPFIIFLMTILGFLNIDMTPFLDRYINALPYEIAKIFDVFFNEVVFTRNLSLLSLSLIVAIYTASSGFASTINALNKIYDTKKKRNFIQTRILCFFIVIIFSALLAISLFIFIFSNTLYNFLIEHNIFPKLVFILNSWSLRIFTVFIIFMSLFLIFKLASPTKQKFREIFPGTAFTGSLWIISSMLFNFYVNNFSRYSTVYGSIGAIFIFFYWINLLSYIFLIGGQINAVLIENRPQLK